MYFTLFHQDTQQFLSIARHAERSEACWTNDLDSAWWSADQEEALKTAEIYPGTRVITILPVRGVKK